MITTETILSLFLGIGLASAAGFRVFLPLFALSLSSFFNVLELNESWQWIGEIPVLIILAVAMIAEIFAYYIPFVDNALDTIAIPLAAIAGTITMASTMVDLNHTLTWVMAIIAGGGTATAMQGMTSITRVASSVKTGGVGNPILSTAETGTAISLSTFAVFLPIVAFILVILALLLSYWIFKKFRKELKK